MAIITRPQTNSSHWYNADGETAHTQKTKDGEERPTNLRDARKLHLLPSVTNVLGVLSKDALTSWKVNQAIIAARANPPANGETDDTYCRRISATANEQVFEAADLGSRIHKSIEAWVKSGENPPPELAPYVEPVIKWLVKTEITVTHSEAILVNTKWGFAGTVDCLFRYGKLGRGVLDFKTRKTTPGEKVRSWETEPMQLAAYAATAYGQDHIDDCLIANIIISTTEPGRVEVVKHTDVMSHFLAFLNAAALWRYLKGYDPRVEE